MEFLKKYWTHIFGIFYFIFFTIMFLFLDKFNDFNIYFILFLLGVMVLGLAAWAEIIYFIIKCFSNKEDKHKVIHFFLIYCFSVIYIPCYYLKFMIKDEKYKIKNVIYVFCTVILYILLIIIVFINVPKIDHESNNTLTDNNHVYYSYIR